MALKVFTVEVAAPKRVRPTLSLSASQHATHLACLLPPSPLAQTPSRRPSALPRHPRCQPLEPRVRGHTNATVLLRSQSQQTTTSLSSRRTTSNHPKHGLRLPAESGRSRRTGRRYRPVRTLWRFPRARKTLLLLGRASRHTANRPPTFSYSGS